MKRLALLRHAKSSRDEQGRNDCDRPLNEREWEAARRMGRELKHRRMCFDLCLASPAGRVRETLDGLTEGFGDLPFPVRFEPRIYMATSADLLDIVRMIENDVQSLLLVGHNPGLHRLAVELTREEDGGLRRRVEDKFPTAAFAMINLPVDRWTAVEPGAGELAEVILPKELV